LIRRQPMLLKTRGIQILTPVSGLQLLTILVAEVFGEVDVFDVEELVDILLSYFII